MLTFKTKNENTNTFLKLKNHFKNQLCKGAVPSLRGTESINHEEKNMVQDLERLESRSSRGTAAAFLLLV